MRIFRSITSVYHIPPAGSIFHEPPPYNDFTRSVASFSTGYEKNTMVATEETHNSALVKELYMRSLKGGPNEDYPSRSN